MKLQEYFLCAKKQKYQLYSKISSFLFNNVFTTFLGLEHLSCIAAYAGSESLWISSKYIYLKMNEGLTGLERHEVE